MRLYKNNARRKSAQSPNHSTPPAAPKARSQERDDDDEASTAVSKKDVKMYEQAAVGDNVAHVHACAPSTRLLRKIVLAGECV